MTPAFSRWIRLTALLLTLSLCGQIHADTAVAEEGWNVLAEFYLWGPDVDLKLQDGTHQEIEFSDLAEITKGGFMGGAYLQRNKWRFGVDAVYLEADDRINAALGEGVELNEAELQVWYASPVVGYQVAQWERSEFYLYGGARYLWGKYTAKIKFSDPNPSGKKDDSESNGFWDGFIGLHGVSRLNDRWYASYQADIGAGESDAVYQAIAAINYRFKRFDATAGYRYMRWDLDADFMETLEFNGFYAGVKVFF